MLALVALAADSPYVLLEPVPLIGTQVTSYGDYFGGLYNAILVGIVALAVLMIVIGGVQYTAASMSPSLKTEAKHRIGAAIGGLVLALMSWMILITINPQILNNTSIGVGDSSLIPVGTGAGGGKQGCVGYAGACGGPTNTTNSDGRLALKTAGVFFDQGLGGLPDCEVAGFNNTCGYFQGIKVELVNYVDKFHAECPTCLLVARDGTGPRHTSADSAHYLGEAADFAPTASLTNHITTKFGRPSQITTKEGINFPVYTDPKTGARWVQEIYPKEPGRDHWHLDVNPGRK